MFSYNSVIQKLVYHVHPCVALMFLLRAFHVESCLALWSRVISPFGIFSDHLAWGKERWSMCFSCLCLFILHAYTLFIFSSSWCQGWAAACDCGTPWSFLLIVLSNVLLHHSVMENEGGEHEINQSPSEISVTVSNECCDICRRYQIH